MLENLVIPERLADVLRSLHPFGAMLVIGFFAALMLFIVIYFIPQEKMRRRRKVRVSASGLTPVQQERKIRDQEFLEVMGQTRQRYWLRTWAIALPLGVALYLTSSSWAISLAVVVTIWYFRRSRTRSKLQKRHDRVLGEEIIPAAQAVAGGLQSGLSLSQSLTDVVRSPQQVVLAAAFRRALSDPSGLEVGLRVEERRTDHDTAKEFFEILADGSSTTRATAQTAETLDRFADLSASRRTSFINAQRVTSQARNTRLVLSMMIPGIFIVSALVGGAGAVFSSSIGNLLILIVMGLLGGAYWVTNSIIGNATKGF